MKTLFTLIVSLLFWCACGNNERHFKKLPLGPVKHHYIVMAKTNDGVRARGFKGAVPENVSVFFEVGRNNKEITANPDGSFDIELSMNDIPERGDLTFTIDGIHYPPVSYAIKKLSDTLSLVAKNPIKTGFEIDYLEHDNGEVAILSSNAALIRLYDMKSTWEINTKAKSTLVLNPIAQTNLIPRMFGKLGDFLLVSFFGTHDIGLASISDKKILSQSRLHDQNGKLFFFENNPALTVKTALNADDTTKTTSIGRSFAHNAEALHALDDERFLASFVNYYQAEDPAQNTSTVLGPGIVALMKKEKDAVKTLAIVTLPFKNPQYFIPKSADEIWVSCSGAYKNIGQTNFSSDNAGLVKLAIGPTTLAMAQQIALPFVPAHPSLIGDTLIVPKAYGSEVLVLGPSDGKFSNNNLKKPDYHRPFSFTLAQFWHDDIAFLATLDGFLVAFSLKDGFFPFPFVEPIALTQKKDAAMIVQPTKLLVRNLEKYEPGYNLWAVSAGHYIMPLDLMEIFGP